MRESTVSAAEAAYLLMHGLGPIRAWPDFLSDSIRGRAAICGIDLMPCCEQHDGRLYRPRYAISDIRDFIERVREICDRWEIKTVKLDIDPEKIWFNRKFDRHGNPVTP